ncbi:glandular kallikrein-3, submandibular-like isoform X2 [Maniola jurtina]|uniref:glandular kallikrein-3, submandibular-like isoform X2 n=1 Tax=Maniola jurtina TaxID=191418 RepID=UPI001E689C4A|nr:glandular kallikrein-3, submandibular-like isoform X2 [Maniola jurtina]
MTIENTDKCELNSKFLCVQTGVASLRNATDSRHLCGAFILTPYAAITAAHCVEHDPEEYSVYLNNYCTRDNEIIPNTQVLEVIRHPLYNRFTRTHDVAVLRLHLTDDITWLNDTVLPNSSFGLSGDCMIYGYGYKDLHTKELSQTLLAANVKILSLDQCIESLGEYVAPTYDSGMLCALGDGVDACEGDSGGPLICAGKVEGIASYGVSCGVPGLPGVYTSIGANLHWLRGLLEELQYTN